MNEPSQTPSENSVAPETKLLNQYLDRYKGLEVQLAKDLPPHYKATIMLAGVAGLTHVAMGWGKATWMTCASFDALILLLALLLIWEANRHKNEAKDKSKAPP